MRPLPPRFETHVVGVTFTEHYPKNLRELWERQLVSDAPFLDVVRDAGNEYDANAVKIVRADTGDHIGHVPRSIAERLAPSLDAGDDWVIDEYDVKVTGTDWAVDQPGLRIHMRRVTTV